MKHASPTILVFTLWLFVIAPLPSAHALSVNYSFTGHITVVDRCGCTPTPPPPPSHLPDFSIGAPFSGTVRYDTTLFPDQDLYPRFGLYDELVYSNPSNAITLTVGGFVFRNIGLMTGIVETSPSNYFIYYSWKHELIDAPSWSGDELGIDVRGGFTTDSLPRTLDLNDHSSASVWLNSYVFYGGTSDMFFIAGQIDRFIPIPALPGPSPAVSELSTLFLFGVGLLVVIAVRTNRRWGDQGYH